MATADNSTDLKRDNSADGVNASIDTLAPTSPTTTGYTDADFSNCISTNTNCINKWGYKNGLSSNYFPFTSGATVLSNTIATNEDTTTLRFAAKIDYNQPSGTYNNELIFTATANPITYNINYYNGYDTSSTGIIGKQDSSTGTTSYVNLAPKDPTTGSPITTPTRATYTFTGWCIDDTNRTNVAVNDTIQPVYNAGNTKVIAYNNPGTVCNGTIYQTGDILTLNPNDTNNINIYAMWIPTTFDQAYLAASKTKDATSGYYTMQDMSATICNAVSENQITTLTDTRINGSYASRANYTIVKLPDGANGRCWMADNIVLDLTNSTTLNSISITNTHVDTASLTSLKSGNRSANARYATAGIASSWTTTDSYTQAMIKKSGINCDASINTSNPCNPNGGTGYSYNSVALQSSGYGISANKLGIFYNYCAASAGNYCYDSNQTTTNNADYDICPANWRLPTGGLSGEPYELFMAIPSATITDPLSIFYRLSAPLSGLYRTGSAWWQGVMGQFLTSTRSTNSRMYMFQFASGGGVGAQGDATRNGGRPVRCIAQN